MYDDKRSCTYRIKKLIIDEFGTVNCTQPGLSGALFLLLRMDKLSIDLETAFVMTEKSGNGRRIKLPNKTYFKSK
ncbi:hypothetical protein EGH73_08630 [Epilithonimonas hominis]|uniref:Uncharacterized protein n=1 Tax=Epilithonimonas hominis TaxID=420404 RepID=A0A3N0X7A8_9FLAO|nr:hypothetical protein EGH73_08630 [Epilithonimonas hominis]